MRPNLTDDENKQFYSNKKNKKLKKQIFLKKIQKNES